MSFVDQRAHTRGIAPRDAACDLCGEGIRRLWHAELLLRYDAHDRLIEAGVFHRSCAAGRRPEPGERLELIPSRDIVASADLREKLRATARAHEGGSVSRVLQKVARLALRDTRAHHTNDR